LSLPALISPIAIAPMIDWTYTHFRVFMRMIAPSFLLYTEMQTVGAVLNNATRALFFDSFEQPLALQLGGAEKARLAECAKLAQELGFREINLNLGCPSDRVQAGHFGACLMAEPQRVFECIQAMKASVSIPITAKTRIGIDQEDSYEFFASFARRLVEAGCDKLIVHARKAWLHGLNPKQNRSIPPLHYDYVYQLKQEFPHLPIVINGNISHLRDINQHLTKVDGVMVGRLAYQNPYALARIQHHLFAQNVLPSRFTICKKYIDYAESKFAAGISLSSLLKPLFNVAYGLPGAKQWKEILLIAQQKRAFAKLYEALDTLAAIEEQALLNATAL
jgi:tRNA-dihydrouridine synthase A